MVDEDAAHGLGGGLQIVAFRCKRALAAEFQECLVDKRCGLKRQPRLFRSEFRSRKLWLLRTFGDNCHLDRRIKAVVTD